MQGYLEGRSGRERAPSVRSGRGIRPTAGQSVCDADHDHAAGWYDGAHVGLFLRLPRDGVLGNVHAAEYRFGVDVWLYVVAGVDYRSHWGGRWLANQPDQQSLV